VNDYPTKMPEKVWLDLQATLILLQDERENERLI